MNQVRRVLAYVAVAVLAAGLAALVNPGAAAAHGALMAPGSRTYLCWKDGLSSTGQIIPKNAACAAAVAKSSATSLYNWFAVLRSDGGGRMAGYIPDGQLCSGGTGGPYDFTGYNLARDDWPVTHLTSGAAMEVDYSDWAKHPGTFSLYVTKDSWSPTRPLAWSDLESAPFDQVTNPPSLGGPGTNDGHYYWNAKLPAGKSGRQIIYSVWSRSDSQETFYGCSDVTFDGGKGEVTGGGGGGTGPGSTPPVTTPPAATATTAPPPVPSPPAAATPPAGGGAGGDGAGGDGAGGCSVAYAVRGSWPNGFQGNVTVTNTGSAPIAGWTVSWTNGAGQDVAQLWSGQLTRSGSTITVTNMMWNGMLSASGSTEFGFIGTGTGTNPEPALTCSAA